MYGHWCTPYQGTDYQAIVRFLVQLNDIGEVGTEEQACEGLYGLYGDVVRRYVAGIISKSTEGVAKMMTVIVTVFAAPGLTVSEKKTDTMLLRTPDQTTFAPPIIESAGQS